MHTTRIVWETSFNIPFILFYFIFFDNEFKLQMLSSCPRCIFFTRMYKVWNRVYQDSWRNISKKSVWAFSLTISLNGVQQLQTLSPHGFIPRHSVHSTQRLTCCFVISSRAWERGSKDGQAVSSVSTAGQREEKSRKSEGDVQRKHGSSAETDWALPHCKGMLLVGISISSPVYFMQFCVYCNAIILLMNTSIVNYYSSI